MILMMLTPLARTSMSEEGGRAMERYGKQVERMLQGLTPWDQPLSEIRRQVKSGTIVVIPDASESPNDPLFKDATILKTR